MRNNYYVVACDSFKGCMTTFEVEEAVNSGILSANPKAKIITIPISDGGDGFLKVLQSITHCSIFECNCHDALMRPITANYGIIEQRKTAIIESALVCGLNLIEPELLNPLKATSYGLGEMLCFILNRGYKSVIIGLGGTATSDCGIGMLKALIDKFCPGKTIYHLISILNERFPDLEITIASDVNNSLYGENGAAFVFGRQKGATDEEIVLLDRRAKTFSEMTAKKMKFDLSKELGAGSAGGLGYAFMQFLNAKLISGANLVLELSNFTEYLDDAKIVITGEGRCDKQSLSGKAPYTIMKIAKSKNIPTIIICGQSEDEELLTQAGFEKIISINNSLKNYTNENQEFYFDKNITSKKLITTVKNLLYNVENEICTFYP